MADTNTTFDAMAKQMISTILAGYAWVAENPYVKNNERINVLSELCRLR